MLRRDPIMIAISPSCLRVALTSGRSVARVESVALDPANWDEAWADDLRPLDEPLKAAVRKLRIRSGASADVMYISPQTVAEVFSAAAGGKAALQAAALALRETGVARDGPIVSSMRQLHRDQPSEGDTPPRPAKTHVLTIADSAACADAVAAWIRRAGLRPSGLLPSKAGRLAIAVRAASSLPTTGTHAVLWMGDHGTTLAGWSDGMLAFVRSIDFGYGLLVDSFVRGARNANPETSLVDRAYAYRLLFEVGIPKRGQTIDASIGLRAESVLPLMQSVIQRYVVETRQTLRFSVPDAEAARATLLLAGPGAQIPGLTATLATQFDIAVEPFDKEPPDTGPGALLMRDAGEIAEAIQLNEPSLRLFPPTEVVIKQIERLNSVLRVGAAAAVMGLAAVGGWALARSRSIETKIASLTPFTEEMTHHDVLRTRAGQLSSIVGSATQTIVQDLGDRPNWFAALGVVSRLAGDAVELSEVTGGYPPEAKHAPVLTLRGVALTSEKSVQTTDALSEFLDRLSRNPLVDSAKVVSTRAGDIQGKEVKYFVLAVQLRVLPPSLPGESPGQAVAGQEPGP